MREVRALTIAAAGGHSPLLARPARTDITRLTRVLPGLLALLSSANAMEVARIHDIAGSPCPAGAQLSRPYWAPHTSAS